MFQFESVTSLNEYIKSTLTDNQYLSNFTITAEISAFMVSARGHAYFSIKDAQSKLDCVIFSRYLSQVSFRPQIGDKVTVNGAIDFYAAGGKLQMQVYSIVKSGDGDLHEQFKRLFAKLENEGLFDSAHKVRIPVLPRRIGVITSASGRVISDIVNTLRVRNPYFDLLLYPASVQGENCPREVIAGLDYFMQSKNVDVIIIARGGGSYEDLFGFNDEGIARKVYECDIPVISAIGHDPDYTILDYVADFRAPTPTGAAEHVIASYNEQNNIVGNLSINLESAINSYMESKRSILNGLINHKALYSPVAYCANQLSKLSALKERMNASMKEIIRNNRAMLDKNLSNLDNLNPNNVLSRGYSYVSNADGVAIESVKTLKVGDNVDIVFSDGKATSVISNIESNSDKEN